MPTWGPTIGGVDVGKPITKNDVPSAATLSLPNPGLFLEHQRLRSTEWVGDEAGLACSPLFKSFLKCCQNGAIKGEAPWLLPLFF